MNNYLSERVAMAQRCASLGERLIEGKFICTEQLTKGGGKGGGVANLFLIIFITIASCIDHMRVHVSLN